MQKVYPKSYYGGFCYEIMDEKAYERYWWGRRPSSREAFETWFNDPNKTQHQALIEYGKQFVGRIFRELTKAGIIRRFKREGYKKSEPKKKRGEFDIFAEILYLAYEGGATKTSIVKQANLNGIIDRYLSELLDSGLIEVSDQIYETTNRGSRFLQHYEELGKYASRAAGKKLISIPPRNKELRAKNANNRN